MISIETVLVDYQLLFMAGSTITPDKWGSVEASRAVICQSWALVIAPEYCHSRSIVRSSVPSVVIADAGCPKPSLPDVEQAQPNYVDSRQTGAGPRSPYCKHMNSM
nr:hypothetical protein CFP56_21270 [Quercus suber]